MAVLRSVAKTDTFEIQRQTINSIGQDLYNLSSGSASQTFGGIQLLDGTVSAPSFSYASENTLGLYRKTLGVLSAAASDKDIVDLALTGTVYYTDINLRKYFLADENLTITSPGSNYSVGDYVSVPLLGGTGAGAVADIGVRDWVGSITNAGSGYTEGSYNGLYPYVISGAGNGDAIFTITVDENGNVSAVTVEQYGTGYTQGTVLGLYGATTSATTLSTADYNVTVSDTSTILPNSVVTGTGIAEGTTVSSIIDGTTVELSALPEIDGASTLTFTPTYGGGNGFQFTISAIAAVGSVTITNGGNGYAVGDTLTVADASLSVPIEYVVSDLSVQRLTFVETIAAGTFSVGGTLEISTLDGTQYNIVEIETSGGNITSVVLRDSFFAATETVAYNGSATPVYTVSVATSEFRAGIDIGDGNGAQFTPNLTLYEDATYEFTYSGANAFALSETQDGPGEYAPSTVVRDTENNTLTVSVTDSYPSTLYYFSTDNPSYGGSSSITIDPNNPSPPGTGFQVLVSTISILDSVALDIIDGSVTALDVVTAELTATTGTVSTLTSTSGDIASLKVTTLTDKGSGIAVTTGGSTNITLTPGNSLNVGGALSIESATGNLTTSGVLKSTGSINSNDQLQISTNQIASLGTSDVVLAPIANTNAKVSGTMSLIIPSGTIDQRPQGAKAESGSIRFNTETQQYEGYNGIAAAWSSLGGVRDVDGNTYILAEEFTGANDNTFWFYNGGTNSLTISQSEINLKSANKFKSTDVSSYTPWAANTYYGLGEFLYEDLNVYEVTAAGLSDVIPPTHETGAVTANGGTPTIAGAIAAFTVSTPSGNNAVGTYSYDDAYGAAQFEIIFQLGAVEVNLLSQGSGGYSTSGGGVDNVITVLGSLIGGTDGVDDLTITITEIAVALELTWYGTTAGNIEFENVNEVIFTDSTIHSSNTVTGRDLLITGEEIEADGDLSIKIPDGSNLVVTATGSLAVPVGDNLQRGTPVAGSIRYNNEINQYEGYNSAASNWSSLGGVRDVDGNTYIIPESSAGANENILYFYNNDDNTLQVTQSQVIFGTIDSISSTSNALNINVENVTFNNLHSGIDVSDATTTLVYSSVNNLDFGLSTGLTVDTVLRLNDAGEILLNKGFGTGVFEGVTFIDAFLKTFELDDVQIKTDDVVLTKGTTDTGTVVLYDPVEAKSSKVIVTAYNTVTEDVHTEEISVIVKGSDLYTVEYGTNKTVNLFGAVVDLNATGKVRLSLSLDTGIATGNVVNITVVRTNVKK